MIITEFEMVKYFYSHGPICLKCMYSKMQYYIVHVADSIPYSYTVTGTLTVTAK